MTECLNHHTELGGRYERESDEFTRFSSKKDIRAKDEAKTSFIQQTLTCKLVTSKSSGVVGSKMYLGGFNHKRTHRREIEDRVRPWQATVPYSFRNKNRSKPKSVSRRRVNRF